MFAAVEFPPIENIVEWPAMFFEGTPFEFNKIALISLIAVIVPVVLFLVAQSKYKDGVAPTGIQTIAESSVDFVSKQIIMPTIGPDGMRYMPLLISMFFFIFIGNLFEIIPTAHMPANARMANPLILALIAYFMFIAAGIKENGLGFFKDALVPPGVPKPLLLLIIPIEFISTFLVRPFSLAVRLFANMLAGHILLITFSVLCISLWGFTPLVLAEIGSFPMLVIFTAFEFGVAFLQAYIFTLLTGVYIGGALHPAH